MPRIDARFRISIRNWSKYQREMRGGGKRNRPRLWIALNTDICRDPEIIGLNMEQRWLWVALLTHAGRVGVEFEVSARAARVLFAMRPGWRAQKDLMRLQEHGFIELTVLTEGEEKPPKKPKKPKKPKEKTNGAAMPPYPDGLNVPAWESFMAYRRELRLRKYTEKGARDAMNKWARYPLEVQAQALQLTIEHNWQGVFPERIRNDNEKAKRPDSFDEIHGRVKGRAGLN